MNTNDVSVSKKLMLPNPACVQDRTYSAGAAALKALKLSNIDIFNNILIRIGKT